MKNILGLLHVIAILLFYATGILALLALILLFYAGMALMVFIILSWLYIILGNTWFFIVVPILLVALVGFQNRKWLLKKLGR